MTKPILTKWMMMMIDLMWMWKLIDFMNRILVATSVHLSKTLSLSLSKYIYSLIFDYNSVKDNG